MKIINISKQRFSQLEPLEISREVFNSEAKMYKLNYCGQNKIVKRLYHQDGVVFGGKLYTAELLDSNKEYLPDSFCIPDYLFSVSNKIEGFTIPELKGINLALILNSKGISKKEQIYYMKKVGELLEQLKHIRQDKQLKDIYLNDLHSANFIVNRDKKQLSVVDLDSCKIGNNIVFPAMFLTPKSLFNDVCNKYKINEDTNMPGYVIADENSDLYCYNIMILNYLYGSNVGSIGVDNFYQYLNYLDEIGMDKNLIDGFSGLLSEDDNKNPVNYLDSITDTQICRAKEKVYKAYTSKKMYNKS